MLDFTLVAGLIVASGYAADNFRFALFYGIPFILTQGNTGYFAWLTHAPARVFEDDPSKSMNTVGNWLNFFIFNQGYHSVHHRYPGIHWSQIPDKFDFMDFTRLWCLRVAATEAGSTADVCGANRPRRQLVRRLVPRHRPRQPFWG